MKILLGLGLILGSIVSFGSARGSDQEERLVKAFDLLKKELPPGTYTGKTDDGEKCSLNVETTDTNDHKGIDDYEASMAVEGRKEPQEFHIFNDGRDFSESWIVEFYSSNDRVGHHNMIKALIVDVDDDGDVSGMVSPEIGITYKRVNGKAKLSEVQIGKYTCLIP